MDLINFGVPRVFLKLTFFPETDENRDARCEKSMGLQGGTHSVFLTIRNSLPPLHLLGEILGKNIFPNFVKFYEFLKIP